MREVPNRRGDEPIRRWRLTGSLDAVNRLDEESLIMLGEKRFHRVCTTYKVDGYSTIEIETDDHAALAEAVRNAKAAIRARIAG